MTPEMKGFLLLSVLKMLFVFTVIMIGVALLTLMERKVSAWMQNRRGPNRVGWAGLLQPAADGVKNILKEETFPSRGQPQSVHPGAGNVVHSRAAAFGGHSLRRSAAAWISILPSGRSASSPITA